MTPLRIRSLAGRGEILSRWGARAGLAVVQTIALFWMAAFEGFPLDDAWIHQVVARTFAETGTLGYLPGQHGAAATSFLWAALMGVNLKFLHFDPVKWAFALNLVSSVAAGQLVHTIVARAVPEGVEERFWQLASALATLLAFTSANLLWYASSGMEAPLLLALSAAAVWGASTPGTRAAWIAGVASALLVWTRPESAPLGFVLGAFLLVVRRDFRRGAAVLVPTVLALVAYVGLNLSKTGHAIPATLSGRRWLWFESTTGFNALTRAWDFCGIWATRLSTWVFDSGRAVIWIMAGVGVYGALRVLRVRNDGVRLLCAWAVMHTGSYMVMLPTPGHGGRYQPFVPLMFVLLLGLGLMLAVHEALRAAAPKRAGLANLALAAAIPIFALSATVLPRMRAANAAAVSHILTTEMGAGAFVDALPKDEVVASFDIGGIGWSTRRPILDIGGLSDPSMAALMQQGRLYTLLEAKNVHYVVLPSGYGEALPVVDDFQGRLHLRDNPAVHLERVFEVESSYERWSAGFDATWNAAPRQIVFKVEPTHRPGPPEVALVAADARRPIGDPARLVNERQRLLTEHMLAVLAAWGLPVDVTLAPVRARGESSSGCAIHLGFWGVEVDGCAAVAPNEVLRSVVYEAIFPYLEQGDLGGAIRSVPHAIARVRRAADPRFDPPLAPVDTPGVRAEPIPFGYGLCLGVAMFAIAAASGFFWRRAVADGEERAKSAAREAEVAAKAVALLVVGLSVFACGHTTAPEAAAKGRGALELAVRAGADLEGRDEWGHTALHVAAASGDVDSVAFLVSRGAKVDERGPDDVTALHLAARVGHDACVARLARTSARDLEAGLRRRTALHDAALAASEGSVHALLEAGSDPKRPDTFGETPLHMLWRPMSPRSPAIASVLLVAGADPSAADARGFTPLHAAALANDVPLVRALAAGASPAIAKRTPAGETPLDLAIRHRADRAAEALLQAGATTSGDAWPPLHEAARIDSVQRASALVADGADVARVWRGKTALEIAREHGSKRVEALLSSWAQPGR